MNDENDRKEVELTDDEILEILSVSSASCVDKVC